MPNPTVPSRSSRAGHRMLASGNRRYCHPTAEHTSLPRPRGRTRVRPPARPPPDSTSPTYSKPAGGLASLLAPRRSPAPTRIPSSVRAAAAAQGRRRPTGRCPAVTCVNKRPAYSHVGAGRGDCPRSHRPRTARQFEDPTRVPGRCRRLCQLALPGMRRQGWGPRSVQRSRRWAGGSSSFPGGRLLPRNPTQVRHVDRRHQRTALRWEVRGFGLWTVVTHRAPASSQDRVRATTSRTGSVDARRPPTGPPIRRTPFHRPRPVATATQGARTRRRAARQARRRAPRGRSRAQDRERRSPRRPDPKPRYKA